MKNDAMSQGERRTAFALAAIYASRMLGLFMILPVFALYAEQLPGHTPTLTGIAIGIYGLTQAVLQIPLGALSDRIGRKPVIIGGLVVFAIGSLVAGLADSIWLIIVGRAIQGCGAIAAAVLALAADLTREENRTKVMAIIGMSIGLSFALSMVLGPLLQGWVGVSGIFIITVLLAFCGILVVKFIVPTPAMSSFHRDTEVEKTHFIKVFLDPQLLRLDIGILILHSILTATFMSIPLVLRHKLSIPLSEHWTIYLPVLLGSLVLLVPFIIYAEKKHRLKQVFSGAILVLTVSLLGMWQFSFSLTAMVLMLLLFFTAFNLLEASLPSLVAKIAPLTRKGTAMGAYTSSQFLGVFLGGLLAGLVSEQYGFTAIFIMNASLAGFWFILATTMKQPTYLSTHLLNVGDITENQAADMATQLVKVQGVAEAVVIAKDSVAYLKVEKHALDHQALQAFSASTK